MTRLPGRLPVGALATAGIAGAGAVAGSYAIAGPTAAFVVVPVSALVVTLTPGQVVAGSITSLGGFAAVLALLGAIGLAVVGFVAVAGLAIRIGHGSEVPYTPAILAGLGGWTLAFALTGTPQRSLGAALPMAAVVALAARGRSGPRRGFVPARRRLLALAAGVAGLSAAGVAARLGEEGPAGAELDLDEATRTDIETRLADARAASLDIEGLTGLVTETGPFYEVDINPTVNPRVDAGGWALDVRGAVAESFSLTYDDLQTREPAHEFMTLRCVGEGLNGEQMDTALWTGVPVAPLLERARPQGGCECVMVRAADDYFEEFPLAALETGMLAYGMNGKPLPRKHGYPVRLLVPGHWGEINVKWVTEIEVLRREAEGFWERRGWHGTGPVNTVAKLHAVNRLGDGRVELGGHAYAGLRGISAVEVSADGGTSWERATVGPELPGRDTWRQWRHELTLEGPTEVVVRAIEADGTVQPKERSQAFPSGATGWVTRTIDPS